MIADAIRLAEGCVHGTFDGFLATEDGLVVCWQTPVGDYTAIVDRADATMSATSSDAKTTEGLLDQFRSDRDARRAAAGG